MTTSEVAVALAVSPGTLFRWRLHGSGPLYLKLGTGPKAPIRYRRSDIEAFLNDCERQMTATRHQLKQLSRSVYP